MCSIKCINYFTKQDYTEEFRVFIRNEKYRSGVKTSARIEPFCKNMISTLVVLMKQDKILEK